MKKLSIYCSIAFFLAACGSGAGDNSAQTSDQAAAGSGTEKSISDYDPNRGEGKFTDVKLDAGLNARMAVQGEKVADLKCVSCHKLTDERLVGPGWKGVTQRHQPEWIMNFMTNTDAMIDKDPKVQAMLEICMVRMPNQNLSDEDARNILEFMRKNDGVK